MYVARMTLDELIAAACPIIKDSGWAFYFTPETAARGAALGLDPVQFYVMGRGGVLGDVESAVVSAAFGYFNPSLVDHMWTAGRAIVSPRVAGAAFMECCIAHGELKLADAAGLAEFVAAGEKVMAATEVDAFALFAGTAAEPAATSAAGRAMQIVTVLREYRGSAHLAAVRAVGLVSKQAHYITRPNDAKQFGWGPDDAPTITDVERDAMVEAEALTDRMVRSAYAALDGSERETFVSGLRAIQTALAA